MSAIDGLRGALVGFATFSGRAGRREFWTFLIVCAATGWALSMLDRLIFGAPAHSRRIWEAPLSGLFGLVMLLPVASAAVRRLHDTGRPGWLLAVPYGFFLPAAAILFGGFALHAHLGIIPGPDGSPGPIIILTFLGFGLFGLAMVGSFVLVTYWLSRPSDPLPNCYGPPPRPVGSLSGSPSP